MRKSIFWISFFFLIQSVSSLSAVDIDSLINLAKQESEILQMYTLNKKASELTLAKSEIKDTLGVSIDGGVGYQAANTTTTVESIGGSVSTTLTLPNDQKTTINLSTGNLSYLPSSSDFSGSPSLSFSHKFVNLDDGDVLDDLQNSASALQIEYSYRINESNFVTSIYNKLIDIITVEKNIISNEKDIITLQTIMDNTITLGTYSKESVKYKSYELSMKNYKKAKANYEGQLQILIEQFKQLTNQPYSAIDMMEIPSLSFKPLSMGNSEVVLASIDLEIAKEQLNLYNRRSVKSGSLSTVPSFMLSGNAGIDYNTASTTDIVDYTIGASGSYTGSNMSVGTSVNLDIDSSGITPSLSVSGSWSNNTSSKTVELERLTLENTITTKELDYTQAMLDYQINSQSLSSDIFNYDNDVSEFSQSKEYNQQVLESQIEAYELGLVKESDVYDARVSIALDEKQEQILALKGRILEQRIDTMQF